MFVNYYIVSFSSIAPKWIFTRLYLDLNQIRISTTNFADRQERRETPLILTEILTIQNFPALVNKIVLFAKIQEISSPF